MKIEGEIYKGKNFFAVLKKYKDNPQVKVFEDMGWYKRKDLVKPIADVAFKLKKGAVSEVIETKLGFHIIKVLNIQRAKGKDFKDVKAKIEDILFKRKLKIPTLTLEADQPGPVDGRTLTRIETFIEMLSG